MAYRMLSAAEAFWRPSNQMGVQNTDLAKQLDARSMGARLWRLAPARRRPATATSNRRSSTSCSRAAAGSVSTMSC